MPPALRDALLDALDALLAYPELALFGAVAVILVALMVWSITRNPPRPPPPPP